jgi:hypothetical protein
MTDNTILVIGVCTVALFVASTGVVAAFLCYAIAQSADDVDDHAFRPAAYQPMQMLTRRPAASQSLTAAITAPDVRVAA